MGYIPEAQSIQFSSSQDDIHTFLESALLEITCTTPSKFKKTPEIRLIAGIRTLSQVVSRYGYPLS